MILGHQRQVDYLQKVLKRGRLAHAYLFHGSEHVGKFTLAQTVAKAFFCEKAEGSLPRVCDECRPCRLIDQNIQPGVYFLDTKHSLSSTKADRREISIEDTRELKRLFALAPVGVDGWRIVIMNEAEKMSLAAANAFLKMLEEPARQILFLLVTSHPELVLPTIISRTQPIRFSLLATAQISDFLKINLSDPQLVKEITDFTNGRPGVMFRLLQDKTYLEKERKLRQEIAVILEGKNLGEALHLSSKMALQDEERSWLIEHFFSFLRGKLLRTQTGVDAIHLMEKIYELDQIATLLETTNVNPRLALDVAFSETMDR